MSFREFLKGLDFDTETIDTIMAEYGKNFAGLKEQNENLKTENKDLKNQVEENKKIDIEAIKTEQFNLGKEEGSKEVETFKKSIALEKALANSKAKDVKLLQKMIDSEKLEYEEKDGDYSVKGLDDQLKSIKSSHSYLFEEEKKPTNNGLNLGGEHNNTPPTSNVTTLAGALHEKYDKN